MKVKVKANCHLFVKGVGHLWPDDDKGDNRKAGRRVEATVEEADLPRYGDALFKVGKVADAAEPEDKQVKGTKTK